MRPPQSLVMDGFFHQLKYLQKQHFRKYSLYLFIAIFFLLSCKTEIENTSVPKPEYGLFQKTFSHNGTVREYLIYIPTSYTGEQSVPLLFSFHGAFGTMQKQYDLSKFNIIADRENFILVTPQSSNKIWNQNSNPALSDDVGFIDALIDDLLNKYNINQNRIYCAGSSNGGFFCYQLACELGSRIAAITSVKGAMDDTQTANCVPSRAVPILELHGTDDKMSPILKQKKPFNSGSILIKLQKIPLLSISKMPI